MEQSLFIIGDCGENQYENEKENFITDSAAKKNWRARLINLNDVFKKVSRRKSFNCTNNLETKTRLNVWHLMWKTFSNYKSIVNILDFIHGFFRFEGGGISFLHTQIGEKVWIELCTWVFETIELSSKCLKECRRLRAFASHVCTDIDIMFQELFCFVVFGSLRMGEETGKTITTISTSCFPNDIDFMFCLDTKFRSLEIRYDIMYPKWFI